MDVVGDPEDAPCVCCQRLPTYSQCSIVGREGSRSQGTWRRRSDMGMATYRRTCDVSAACNQEPLYMHCVRDALPERVPATPMPIAPRPPTEVARVVTPLSGWGC